MRIHLIIIMTLCFMVKGNAQLLWRISGNEIKSPSYLFGTNHTETSDFCDSISGFDKAFNSCEEFYGEIDLIATQKMSHEEVINIMTPYILLPKDTSLVSLFSNDEYKIIDSVLLDVLKIGCNKFAAYKPAYINIILGNVLGRDIIKITNPKQTMDAMLQNRAIKSNMRVKGLESFESQLQLLYGSLLSEQAATLLEAVETIDKGREYIVKVHEFYRKQNIVAFYEMIISNYTDKNLNRMLYNRNINWVKQLKFITDTPTFIAVGYGHLCGEKGLITLLQQQGYKVEPVK